MKYTVYVHGCETCGMKAVYLHQFKVFAAHNGHTYTIYNSKHDQQHQATHAEYSKSIKRDEYLSIVVDEHNVVERLEAPIWKLSNSSK